MVLKSLATFLQKALSVAGDGPSGPSSSWYMSSAFASTRAHRSFNALFDPSLTGGPSKAVWKPEGVLSEDQFIGTFPFSDTGVNDGFSWQDLPVLHSAVSAESGSSSTRLKHISVRFSSRSLSRPYSFVHSVWRILCIL